MTKFRTLDDLGDIEGKVALVRVDLNLPMQDGAVTDDTRIRAALPTIIELADKGAKVLLLAHFGRPKGARNSEQSLSMVVGPQGFAGAVFFAGVAEFFATAAGLAFLSRSTSGFK